MHYMCIGIGGVKLSIKFSGGVGRYGCITNLTLFIWRVEIFVVNF